MSDGGSRRGEQASTDGSAASGPAVLHVGSADDARTVGSALGPSITVLGLTDPVEAADLCADDPFDSVLVAPTAETPAPLFDALDTGTELVVATRHEDAPSRAVRVDGDWPDGAVAAVREGDAPRTDAAVLERYRTITETVADGIYTTDTEARFDTVNDAFVELTGHDRETLLGSHVSLVLDEAAVAEGTRLRAELSVAPERVVTAEYDLRTASGEVVPCEVRFTALTADGAFAGTAGVVRDVSERRRRERQVRALQRVTQELIVAETERDVAERAVETAREILDFPITGVWCYDEAADELRPLAETDAATDLFGGPTTFQPGDSLAWRAFETGKTRVYDDVRAERGRHNPETEIRAEIVVPLGEQGVMGTGTTARSEFDDRDVELFRILAASVEAALVRADRERQLRERERRLAEQNERLDEFASVLAHDLRNPLSIATSYLSLLREEPAPEHFDRVGEALDRIDRLVDDLLTIARGDGSLDDRAPVDLGTLAEAAWKTVETADADLVLAGPPTVSADRGQLRQLLENLVRNAVEHGGPTVTVTVGALPDGGGFFVADDGPGIPPADREAVFEHGFSGANGTGLGLAIVRATATAHGWTVSVVESETGGARFEFRTREAVR